MENTRRFESALYGIGIRLRDILQRLPHGVRNNVQEIRLRRDLPVTLTVNGETVFVGNNSQIYFHIVRDLAFAYKEDLNDSFRLLCRGSAFAHSEELKNGFIMMRQGHRAGVCGTLTAGGIMRDISSINIRIAREIKGAANPLIGRLKGGMLIAGPPGSGKTTILRDLIRQLSDGANGKFWRVCVIDSRGEISGSCEGQIINDLGRNTDVLLTPDKAAGIEIAVRTMFPDIVAFDEIGTAEELRRVSESFNAGVRVLTTAHISGGMDLLKRSVTNQLINSGAIDTIAVLPPVPGGKIQFYDKKELSANVVR